MKKMKLSRRDFLKNSASITGGLFIAAPLVGCATSLNRKPDSFYSQSYYGYGYYGSSYEYGYYSNAYYGQGYYGAGYYGTSYDYSN